MISRATIVRGAMCEAQAVTLILQGLGLDTLLQLLAEGGQLASSGRAPRAPAARRQLDEELSSWEAASSPSAHAPILLAWAAFAALAAQLIGSDGAYAPEHLRTIG